MQFTSRKTLVNETASLRAYLKTSSLMRGILSEVWETSEPSILEFDLGVIKDASPDFVRWRVMEHSLLVSRLYAVFENFCESLLEEWVEFISKEISYENLPDKVLHSYPSGFSLILGMLPSSRYPNFNVKDMISDYHSILKGDNPYRLNPAYLIHHKNNLRWSEIVEIFGRCGINDASGWINRSNSLLSYFSDNPDKITEQVTSKLENFIQYRNDSSHGIVETDEILGHDELNDIIDFISSLSISLEQLVLWKMVEVLNSKNRAVCIGRVTEILPKANAFILTSESARLEVGQEFYVKKGGNFWSSRVESIMFNNAPVDITITEKGDEMGIRLNVLPENKSMVYIILPTVE